MLKFICCFDFVHIVLHCFGCRCQGLIFAYKVLPVINFLLESGRFILGSKGRWSRLEVRVVDQLYSNSTYISLITQERPHTLGSKGQWLHVKIVYKFVSGRYLQSESMDCFHTSPNYHPLHYAQLFYNFFNMFQV